MSIQTSLTTLLALLPPWHKAQLVDHLADEVATNCGESLWQRIRASVCRMSVAETRGYAIAHAAGIAEAEVDQIFARRRYSPVLRARVVDSAVARLVNIVIHNTLTVPSPNTARMKAA